MVPTIRERPDAIWHRCPACSRLIAPMRDGCFFPHLDHPTRRKDRTQESLEAYGANRRQLFQPAEPAAGAPEEAGAY